MGLTTKGRIPQFQGNLRAVVPTPTFSGRLTDDPADSINPNTGSGPGTGGSGVTFAEVSGGGSGFTGTLRYKFDSQTPPANTQLIGSAQIVTPPVPTPSGAAFAVQTFGAANYFNTTPPELINNIGSQDFTLAFNILIPTGAGGGGFFEELGTGGTNPKLYYYWIDGYQFQRHLNGGGIFRAGTFDTFTVPANEGQSQVRDQWNEFRIVRSGNTVTTYWRGINAGSHTGSGVWPDNSSFNYGRVSEVAGSYNNLYFDDIRWWIGQAVTP